MALQRAGCLLVLGLSLVLAASVEDLHRPSEEVWEEVWEEHFHLESWQDPPEHDPCFGCLLVKMFVITALAALAALYTIVLAQNFWGSLDSSGWSGSTPS